MYVFKDGVVSRHKCHHVAVMYMCHAMYVTVTHIYTPLCTTVLTNTHLRTSLVTLSTCYTSEGVLCHEFLPYLSLSRMALVKNNGR